MKRIKVRFNLGAGKNYMKWKVEYPDGRVEYHHPSDVQLSMSDCQLKNHKKTALKIYEGANKTVCAWVLCQSIELKKTDFIKDESRRIRYNPRIKPNWILNEEVVDGMKFDRIHSIDYGLYLT